MKINMNFSTKEQNKYILLDSTRLYLYLNIILLQYFNNKFLIFNQ